MMKRNLIILLSCLLFACVWWEERTGGGQKELIFHILPQLPQNSGGYFFMTVASNSEPAIHKVYAYVGMRDYHEFTYSDLSQATVSWHSNMYTMEGDSLGYYRKRRFVDQEWKYIRNDSITTFTGDTTQFIPVMSPLQDVSDDSGMVSTTINIPAIMFNDTLILEAATLDQFDNCPLDSCYVGIPILFR